MRFTLRPAARLKGTALLEVILALALFVVAAVAGCRCASLD